jgi:hypothetical protein
LRAEFQPEESSPLEKALIGWYPSAVVSEDPCADEVADDRFCQGAVADLPDEIPVLADAVREISEDAPSLFLRLGAESWLIGQGLLNALGIVRSGSL